MSRQRVTEESKRFYERYPFPGSRPIDQDGLILLRRITRSMTPRLRGRRGAVLRVLDAGCGTGNTSVALARQFPLMDILGIDQSVASLEKARAVADTLGLENIRFRSWDLMKPLTGERSFDLILCLGVLHHVADMKEVLANLRRALRSDGELYLWIYGRHGRYRHSLNMRLLALLQTTSPPCLDPVDLARELLRYSAENGVMTDLLGNIQTGALQERSFDDPVWVADQWLNPRETLVDMTQLLRLATRSGLSIDEVVGMNENAAKRLLPPLLEARFRQLGRRRQLIALDLIMKPERYFAILRRNRPTRES
jgi:2-polyprenyl-3-methyl-5-hydroxy-6-metoxy-1,4-benzoquinol methylase